LVKQFGLLSALEKRNHGLISSKKQTHFVKTKIWRIFNPYEKTAALYTTTPQKHVSDLTPTFYIVIVVTAI